MNRPGIDPQLPPAYRLARNRRLDAMAELDIALDHYWDRVLPQPVPLPFSLAAGQPVYDFWGLDCARVAADEAPLAVSLDPERRWLLPPPVIEGTELDTLVLGSNTFDTFLIHLDFAAAPHFDSRVYYWLRLDDLLPCLWRSGSPHADPLQRLWRLRLNRPLLRARGRTPRPLNGPYSFFDLPPLF